MVSMGPSGPGNGPGAGSSGRRSNPWGWLGADVFLVFLVLVSLGVGLWLGVDALYERSPRYLTLASGSEQDETYGLARAIARTVESQYPSLHVTVQPTLGSRQNLQMLEQGEADLAIAQADLSPGPQARMVLDLYRDAFQIVVRADSTIEQFADLRGRRVGLLPESGQFRSFLKLAEHYGMEPQVFKFVGKSEAEIEAAFRSGEVEAVFRVRSPGNLIIRDLVQKSQGRLLPIDQAAAIQVYNPMLVPTVIPVGTYQGNPAVPGADLVTVSVQRSLLASAKLSPSVVQKISQVLNEQRRAIVRAGLVDHLDLRPWVGKFQRPGGTGIGAGVSFGNNLGSNLGSSLGAGELGRDGLTVPLHPGAMAYYNRDKPSFWRKNIDLWGFLLNLVVFVIPLVGAFKLWLERQQRTESEAFIQAAIDLLEDSCDAAERLLALDRLFTEVTRALVREDISQESLRTFNEVYRSVREVLVTGQGAGLGSKS